MDGRGTHVCVVADALLVAAIGSAIAMTILALFPQAMFPNSEITGLEWALPITVFALAWSDICLAALAYRHGAEQAGFGARQSGNGALNGQRGDEGARPGGNAGQSGRGLVGGPVEMPGPAGKRIEKRRAIA